MKSYTARIINLLTRNATTVFICLAIWRKKKKGSWK